MGDYVKVNTKGFKELGLTLRKVATGVVGASAVGQYNAAVEIVEAAQANAPVSRPVPRPKSVSWWTTGSQGSRLTAGTF